MNEHKSKLTNSFAWKLLERGSVVLLQFSVQMILVRLLSPEDYGIVTIVTSLIAVVSVFLQAGVTKALIQFKNINSKYYYTAAIFSIFLGVLIYSVIFLIAPIFELYFQIKNLVGIVRLLGICIIFTAFSVVPEAYLIRKAKYNVIFLAYFCGVIFSGLSAIICALLGLGLWALVIQQLTNLLICALVFWLGSGFKLKLHFSFKKLKALLFYSYKITAAFFLDVFFSNFQSIWVGKLFTPGILGLVSKGQQFPLLISTNLDSIIQSVMLRDLSTRQHNIENQKIIVRTVIITLAFLLFPILALLIYNAKNVVIVILSEKWIDSSKFLIVYTIVYIFVPFSSLNIQVINSLGKSNVYFRNEIIKKSIGLAFFIVFLNNNFMYFFMFLISFSLFSFFIDSNTNKTLINYGFVDQVCDLLPNLSVSIVSYILILPLKIWKVNPIMAIILSVVIYLICYLIISKLLRLRGLQNIEKIMRKSTNSQDNKS